MALKGLLLFLLATAALAEDVGGYCDTVEDCYRFVSPCENLQCYQDVCIAISAGDDCPCPEQVEEVAHVEGDACPGSSHYHFGLSRSTFDYGISKGVWFVDFTAPWCGWCKNLNPTWRNLHRLVLGRWNVATVDCKEEAPFCQERFDIKGFPTLMLFVDGKEVATWDRGPQRTFWTLIRWVEEMLPSVEKTCLPSSWEPSILLEEESSVAPSEDRDGSVVVLSDENIGATVGEGYWFVKFYAPWCGHCKKMADEWRSLASENPSYNIADLDCTVHKEAGQTYGVRGFPTIILLKDGVKHAEYSGSRTTEAFVKFLEENAAAAAAKTLPHAHDEL